MRPRASGDAASSGHAGDETGARSSPRGESRRGRRSGTGLLGFASGIGVALLCIDFLAFTGHVIGVGDRGGRADGIVALTGGAERIEAAMQMLRSGAAPRLLISGVNPSTTEDALRRLHPSYDDLFQCCVDIGRQALDTRGNAEEARDWVLEKGYRSLIVVTSAYHMPRSLVEIRDALPDTRLVPHPVRALELDESRWYIRPQVLGLLAREYLKYLYARLT